MPRDLTNRVLVITGASSGIGAATVVACARAGMDVVLNGRDGERLEQIAQQVRAGGRTAETVVGNVTAPGLNKRLLDVAEERFGHFDVVFANAGYGFSKPAHALDDAELRRIFDVNFFAANELICAAARRLLAHKQPGHLLMCSSAVAKFTLREFSAYSATKAAQNHICRAMRMELRKRGIEVASVHPVTTRTAFFQRAGEHGGQQCDPDHAFDHVPGWLLQPPERVATAIVRCLRRPRPEVWTSLTTRLIAGLITAFPGLGDIVGRLRRS